MEPLGRRGEADALFSGAAKELTEADGGSLFIDIEQDVGFAEEGFRDVVGYFKAVQDADADGGSFSGSCWSSLRLRRSHAMARW